METMKSEMSQIGTASVAGITKAVSKKSDDVSSIIGKSVKSSQNAEKMQAQAGEVGSFLSSNSRKINGKCMEKVNNVAAYHG